MYRRVEWRLLFAAGRLGGVADLCKYQANEEGEDGCA